MSLFFDHVYERISTSYAYSFNKLCQVIYLKALKCYKETGKVIKVQNGSLFTHVCFHNNRHCTLLFANRIKWNAKKDRSVFDYLHFVLFNSQFIVSKEDKLTLRKVFYNGSPFVQVAQVCKVFQVFLYSSCCRTFDFKRSSFKIIVASLVLSPFLVLFCFVPRFFTCQQRICIANMQFFLLWTMIKTWTHIPFNKHYHSTTFDQLIRLIRDPLSLLFIDNIVVILFILFTFFCHYFSITYMRGSARLMHTALTNFARWSISRL